MFPLQEKINRAMEASREAFKIWDNAEIQTRHAYKIYLAAIGTDLEDIQYKKYWNLYLAENSAFQAWRCHEIVVENLVEEKNALYAESTGL